MAVKVNQGRPGQNMKGRSSLVAGASGEAASAGHKGAVALAVSRALREGAAVRGVLVIEHPRAFSDLAGLLP